MLIDGERAAVRARNATAWYGARRLNLWQGAQPIAFEALRIRAFEFGDESMSPPYPRGLTGYGATTPHAQRPCDARIA
jgi:hypothetical protein